MQEVDNVLRILNEARKAIEQNDSIYLKNLSDQTIHTATIYQDSDNIVVAVLIYSLSKIIERDNYRTLPGWKEFYHALIKNLESCIASIEKNDIEKFRYYERNLRLTIGKIDGKLADYIGDVFKKAKINKASKIYQHGLSMEKTADLLGVSLWELSSYVGQSRLDFYDPFDVKKRIKIAEEIFS